MKVAIVHELLTIKGGAEKVARKFAEMFPDAPIYTLLYNQKKLGDWFPKERIVPSSIQAAGYGLRGTGYNHHYYLSRFPSAIEQWDFSAFDLVISSSSAFAHNIITNGKPRHLSYIHSPARYLWDRTHDVVEHASGGILGPLKRVYLEKLFHRLRIWDSEASARADMLIAASKEVQRRIELYYNRNSDVIYPFLDNAWLSGSVQRNVHDESPFLIVSTLAKYKRIDIAIEACNQLNLPLIIAGEGSDAHRLQKLAGPSVEFIGFQDVNALRTLYGSCKALLFPGTEDFGITPLEAMSQGCPIIAFKEGGALETVIEGTSGSFFAKATAESFVTTLQQFDHKKYSVLDCQKTSEKFRESDFEQQIRSKIDALMSR